MIDEDHPINSIQLGGLPSNKSEAYLDKLARNSFLSLWSFPRIFNNQKDNPSANQGKEVVDLMVVFDRNIILFSDKWCEFKNSGNLNTDWTRWKKKAIDKSIRQLLGAERWIRQFPDRLFLDKECKETFPFPLPPVDQLRFFRIAIANGSASRSIEELGGSGSLMVSSFSHDPNLPFMVCHPSDPASFVHVLDETTFDILLKELDTITDFVQYLEKKEAIIAKGHHLSAAGEEELLAHYLKDVNQDGEHDFRISADSNLAHFDEGFWSSFLESSARKSRIEANEISYTWDGLIEKFNYHALTHTLYLDPGREDHERCLRLMAAESRTRRRLLSTALYDALSKSNLSDRHLKLASSEDGKFPTYIFLTLKRTIVKDYDEYRQIRQAMLSACCQVAVLVDPTATHFIGLGFDNYTEDGEMSEDLVYMDATTITPEFLEYAQKLQEKTGFFTNIKGPYRSSTNEYPNS